MQPTTGPLRKNKMMRRGRRRRSVDIPALSYIAEIHRFKYPVGVNLTPAQAAALVVPLSVAGAQTRRCSAGLCNRWDLIFDGCCRRAVSKVFKGKSIEKGVAFPTCISVNK